MCGRLHGTLSFPEARAKERAKERKREKDLRNDEREEIKEGAPFKRRNHAITTNTIFRRW